MSVHLHDRIVQALAARGIEGATAEYPGCIQIPRPYGLFMAGDVNPTWGADFYHDAEDFAPAGGIDTTVLSDSDDAEAIAEALVTAMQEFHTRGGAGR